jgi:SPP1 family predicted phage head-tail adaptor
MTIIKNNSDFEKAYTNFTIRYPLREITREMLIEFRGKTYTIEYLNNINEANVELEIQAKEVTH